jgi:hypothetical protein
MHGAITPLPHYVFMAWFLVKDRDNLTFALQLTKNNFTVVRHPAYIRESLVNFLILAPETSIIDDMTRHDMT